jgi:hypothetical protein
MEERNYIEFSILKDTEQLVMNITALSVVPQGKLITATFSLIV